MSFSRASVISLTQIGYSCLTLHANIKKKKNSKVDHLHMHKIKETESIRTECNVRVAIS